MSDRYISEEEFWKEFTPIRAGMLQQAGDVRSSKSDYTYKCEVPEVHFGTPVPRPEDTDFLYYRPKK